MTNICTEKLSESKLFYTTLFDFKVDFDSDWFIHLISGDMQYELGLIQLDHEIIPQAYRNSPDGFYITFVVDNVEEVFNTAQNNGFEVVSEPKDTFYGQRRLLLKEPSGTLVDVSSPIPDFKF